MIAPRLTRADVDAWNNYVTTHDAPSGEPGLFVVECRRCHRSRTVLGTIPSAEILLHYALEHTESDAMDTEMDESNPSPRRPRLVYDRDREQTRARINEGARDSG